MLSNSNLKYIYTLQEVCDLVRSLSCYNHVTEKEIHDLHNGGGKEVLYYTANNGKNYKAYSGDGDVNIKKDFFFQGVNFIRMVCDYGSRCHLCDKVSSWVDLEKIPKGCKARVHDSDLVPELYNNKLNIPLNHQFLWFFCADCNTEVDAERYRPTKPRTLAQATISKPLRDLKKRIKEAA